MTVADMLSRISSRELAEQMAFDRLDAEGYQPKAPPVDRRSGAKGGASIRPIALVNRPAAEIFAELDRYWPPER
jgi:hypothetical protein